MQRAVRSLIFHTATLHYCHVISNYCTFLQGTELIIHKRISLTQMPIIHVLKTSFEVLCISFDDGLKSSPTNHFDNCRFRWCTLNWDSKLNQVHVSVLHHCVVQQFVIVCAEAAALSLVCMSLGQQPTDRTIPCF